MYLVLCTHFYSVRTLGTYNLRQEMSCWSCFVPKHCRAGVPGSLSAQGCPQPMTDYCRSLKVQISYLKVVQTLQINLYSKTPRRVRWRRRFYLKLYSCLAFLLFSPPNQVFSKLLAHESEAQTIQTMILLFVCSAPDTLMPLLSLEPANMPQCQGHVSAFLSAWNAIFLHVDMVHPLLPSCCSNIK